jgi:hypothetical protein
MNTINESVQQTVGYYTSTFSEVSPLLKVFAIVMVVGAYVIYYIYNKSVQEKTQPVFISGPRSAKSPQIINRDEIPESTDDDAYSIGFWFWVDDWSYKNGQFKHILHRGGVENNIETMTQPIIFFDSSQNNLVIRYDTKRTYNRTYNFHKDKIVGNSFSRFSETNTTLRTVQTKCDRDANCAGFTAIVKDNRTREPKAINGELSDFNINSVVWGSTPQTASSPLNNITDDLRNQLSGITTYGYTFGTFLKGGLVGNSPTNDTQVGDREEIVIPNIPLNRWCYLAVVASYTHIDVYFNGKLFKSVVLKNALEINNGDLYVSRAGGFSGAISQLIYYNRSLTLPEINKTYLWGPDPWTWESVMRKINQWFTQYTIKIETPAIIDLIPQDQLDSACQNRPVPIKKAAIYTGVGYTGSRFDLLPGEYATSNSFGGRSFDAQINSIKVPAGLRVIVYQESSFAGGSYTFNAGDYNDLTTINFVNPTVPSTTQGVSVGKTTTSTIGGIKSIKVQEVSS